MKTELAKLLVEFRACFSRRAAFHWFVIVIFGLIVRSDARGVTSFIRCFAFAPGDYYSLLHFFTASSWRLEELTACWIRVVDSYTSVFTVAGFVVLIGDGIKVAKEARRMPGVKKLRQQSENSTKPPYIFGHHFGVVAILTGTMRKLFAIPLKAELHEGVEELRTLQGKSSPTVNGEQRVSLVTLMMSNAVSVARSIGRPCLIVLDAFYAVGPTFLMARNLKDRNGRSLLQVITRAKKNAVAYFTPPAIPKGERGRGRPRKYGPKVKLQELFTTMADEFKTVSLHTYGKRRTVSYLCLDLIWKPIKDTLRFVLVKEENKKIILICSDLEIKPTEIILAYSYRFKIELTFYWLKNLLGGFCYHFWSKALNKLKHKQSQFKLQEITDPRKRKLIANTAAAIEAFVTFSCIALGLLQILAQNLPETIWKHYTGWLRTKSSAIPSEEVVMSVIRCNHYNNFLPFSDDVISRIIQDKQRKSLHLYEGVTLDRTANF